MKNKNTNTSNNSLLHLADKLVVETKKLLRQAKTEDELKIGFEKILEPIRQSLGITINSQHGRTNVIGRRPDAVHGQVIIEYEPPASFASERNIKHAYSQLVDDYLPAESKKSKPSQLVGVGFDGHKIFFVQTDKTKVITKGPYDFTPESARTFLIHLRALARRSLTAENLADRFGPESELAVEAIGALAQALEHWDDHPRVRTFFNEWKRLFGIVYGDSFSGQQEKEAEALARLYKVSKETDFQELLFCVHTYFAFLMKLIAAELLTLRETTFESSLALELAHMSEDELKRRLEDIEDGGVYARRGITNFLEGDFFRWYLDAWSPALKDSIQEVARAFSEFEPATSTLDPNATRDLLKKVYQYLVPTEVRHRLGEYYTPDWLAELVLNEVGYKGDSLKRLLDPACGSGTFLVLAIQRIKDHGKKEGWPPLEIAKRIVANVWGFDLNPLAVIAARTNYLFALGDLANELQQMEIPIYLTDSVLTSTRTTGNLFGDFLEVSTSVGKFQVPAEWVKNSGFLLQRAAPLVEEMTKNGYEADEAMKRLEKEGLVFSYNREIVKVFYNQILDLEKQNKNGIWARFLKNSFAPMVAGKFDFVVGNPPWIMWQYLSRGYREATQSLWDAYGLTRIGQARNVLIRGRRDFSMLFVYASADYYLKEGAKLGFLITQEVFKSKGAGEGFRRFQLGDGKHLKVLKAHDLVSIQPFEGATNKTAAIFLKKGEKTNYPVSYTLWYKKKGLARIPTDKLLEEVSSLLQRKRFLAEPVSSKIGPWRTHLPELKHLGKIEGKNYYKAHRGTAIDPYGIFWLEVKQVKPGGTLLVRNLTEHSRRNIPTKEAVIENDLVYPGLRGSDIARWYVNFQVNVLITHPGSQQPYSESVMKQDWPRTFNYLLQFREILIDRGVYRHFHEKSGNPFYGQRDFGEYTFSKYKVLWKRMSNDIFATVSSQVKTPYGYKRVIPLDTTSFFATDSESESHYLCAIINSKPTRDFIKSFSSAGRGFGSPSVMEHVGIPKFDPKNKLHQKLVEISKKCHQLKLEGKEGEIEKLEKENDTLVKRLFGPYS